MVAARCSLVVNINSTPKVISELVRVAVLVSFLSSHSGSFPVVIRVESLPSSRRRILPLILERGSFQLWFCVDARVGNQRGKTKLSRGLSESTLTRSKTPTGLNRMAQWWAIDDRFNQQSIRRLTKPRALLVWQRQLWCHLTALLSSHWKTSQQRRALIE